MLRAAPTPNWIDRFQQLAANPERAAAPIQDRSTTLSFNGVLLRRIAIIAAAVFAGIGYVQGRRSFYLVATLLAVGSFFIPPAKKSKHQPLTDRINLNGIVHGLNALTEFKIERCIKSFNNVNVAHIANRHAVVPAAINQWSAAFDGEKMDTPELDQLRSDLEESYIEQSKEVQNYRKILPFAKQLIAQGLNTSNNRQLVEIWKAAWRFVYGFKFDHGEMKSGYVNWSMNQFFVIKARGWDPII